MEKIASMETERDLAEGLGGSEAGDEDHSPRFRSDINIEPHEFSSAFVARGKNEKLQLLTRCDGCTDPGCEAETFLAKFNGECGQFCVWSPLQNKLAAALLLGVDLLRISEGSQVMFLGNAISCSVAHLSDMVGDTGVVYAIETSPARNEDLLALAMRRDNVVAIVEDATLPYKYRRLVPDSVEFIFCDTLHAGQLRLLILHARHFLRPGGHFAITLDEGVDVASRLHAEQLETLEQISLEPYFKGQFLVAGVYNPGVRESPSET